MKELTYEEHQNYKHLCGLMGKEIENIPSKICLNFCKKFDECIETHCILGVDCQIRKMVDSRK